MSKKSTIPGSAEAWESGELGRSAAHVRKTPSAVENQIDEALGLQAISIRLPRATIETYKQLAEMHGVGYQPLMREAICRWAESELKMLLAGHIQSQRESSKRKAERSESQHVKKQSVEDSHQPPLKKAA